MVFGRVSVLAAAVVVLAVGAGVSAARQSAAPADPLAVCRIETDERVVAIGDVHGAYERLVAILRAANLVDARARWTGGRAILVQTGDVVDRGPDSRRVLDILMRLQVEAARAGGRVVALLGNHEAMRVMGQWHDVSPAEFAAFRTPDSTDVREQVYSKLSADAAARARAEKRRFDGRAFRHDFMREVPLGFIEMRQAFAPTGVYGAWLREQPAVARINGVVFVHGGVDVTTAPLGCDGINRDVGREMNADAPPKAADLPLWITTRETGPLWFRGLALAPETDYADALSATLRTLGARAMVVGHTPVNGARITPRFGSRVMLLDTGMLGGRRYPGGVASALELHGDTLTAIYTDRREHLPPLTPAVP